MATLNRFPLLGLWAAEAARRAGYRRDEAEALGHAYAVLYAIRAARVPRTEADRAQPAARRRHVPAQTVRFGGDDLPVTGTADGHLRGLVGGEQPQTPASYRSAVRAKFPAGAYDRLRRDFRRVLGAYPPRAMKDRLVYDLYDEWKRACGVGRLVDLAQLHRWCAARAGRQRMASGLTPSRSRRSRASAVAKAASSLLK